MLVGRSSAVASAKWSRKPGPISVPNAASPSLTRALDEVDRRDPLLAVRAHVVADDEGAVGPADEHRPVEAQLVDDRGEVVGPELAVGVVLGLERRLGHAVAAQVEGDEPELVGQRALVLLGPAQMVLRPAVDEQDRRPVRLAPLAHVQPQTAAAPYRVDLIGSWPLRARVRHCSSLASSRSSIRADRRQPGAGAHRAEGLIFRRSGAVSSGRAMLTRTAGGGSARYWPDGGSRERRVRRTRTRARGARARARRDAGRAAVRPSSSPETRASARPGWCPSSPDAPATPGSRSSSGARSISSARSCRTSRSSRHCVRSGSPCGRWATAGSQLRVFEETLALLTDRAAAAPVLLVLEDLHWADTSTLDLVVFLAHNLDDRPVLLLATYRAGRALVGRARCAGSPTASGARARRSCSSSGRSTRDELAALLAARADAPLPRR